MSQPHKEIGARAALIAKRDSEARALEKEKASIAETQKRIDSHSSRINLLNEMIAEMSQQKNGDTPSFSELGKYSTMTTREGIMDILSQAGAGIMIPSMIAKRLQAEGSKSKSENFSTIVSTECKRLAALGKLERQGKGFQITRAGLLSTI